MLKSPVYRWALYDWANSAYATAVVAGFFPIFFRDYWNAGQAADAVTLRLGVSNSLASLIIALTAPLLGALADLTGCRSCFLKRYALIGILATAGLFLVPQGQWFLAAALYVLATAGFMGANVFYDAMLTEVAKPEQYDRVSALGYGMGYLGGGLLFAGCAAATVKPEWFGLNGAAEAVRWSFLVVAMWWAVFSLPVLSLRPPVRPRVTRESLRQAWCRLSGLLASLRAAPQVLWFVLAYWFYIDGVDTIIVMAVDYGRSLGFGSQDLILALLITQFIGLPAALVFGRLGERFGTRRSILIAIAVYCGITVWGSQIEVRGEFYGIAIGVGLVQGGLQSLSRSLYARLIPPQQAAEFFGFYNVLGKFAAVLGPVLVGLVGAWTGNPRMGILSILILFIIGGAMLVRLKLPPGTK